MNATARRPTGRPVSAGRPLSGHPRIAVQPDVSQPALTATTPQRIAHRMRIEIAGGILAFGERMKIDDLATRYGVSHMPIREALRELEAEGLVEISAHRGATVHGVDEAFIDNICDIREALEVMLTERCALRATEATVALLREQVRRHAALAKEGGPDSTEALVAANRAIHQTINAGAGNPQALRLLSNGRVLVEALRISYGFRPGRVRQIVTEHKGLLEAIATKDSRKAGAIAREHCARAREDMLAGFRDTARPTHTAAPRNARKEVGQRYKTDKRSNFPLNRYYRHQNAGIIKGSVFQQGSAP
jgi:DNA-binding GntR family transcriptional regulator